MYVNSNNNYYSEWTILYNDLETHYFNTEDEMLNYLSIKTNQKRIGQVYQKDYVFDGLDVYNTNTKLYNINELLTSINK